MVASAVFLLLVLAASRVPRMGLISALCVAVVTHGKAYAADVGPFVAFDVGSGAIIDARQPDRSWHPASITKLMTAYVAFEAVENGQLTLQSPVVQSANSLSEPPSKMGFQAGTIMTLDNALKMLIVKSANDIAVAIGEAVAGSEREFVARMNASARRLGMAGTNFENPNGLHHPNQYTTARDMARLTQALLTNYKQHSEYFSINAIRHGKRVLRSHNLLLTRYPGATGMKTGFICPSGFNLVASAERNGREIGVVVLGGASSVKRAERAAKLFDKGFSLRGAPANGKYAGTTIYAVAAATNDPPDLRPVICKPEARQARFAERDAFQKATSNGNTKKFVLAKQVRPIEPVRVYTGLSAGGTTSTGATLSRLPRPRPDRATSPVAVTEKPEPAKGIGVPLPQPRPVT